MVELSIRAEKSKVMVAPKWHIISFLPLILLLDSSSAYRERDRLYGDVSEDEIAIDHLEDVLRAREVQEKVGSHDYPYAATAPRKVDHLPDIYSHLKIAEKIPFAVTPTDLRYYLPRSVLQNGLEGLPNEEGSLDDHNGISSNSNAQDDQQRSYPPELLQELYQRYEHLVPGPDGPKGEEGFYRGHKFGSLPPSVTEPGSDHPKSDSVNFWQTSQQQAQVPNFYVEASENTPVLSDFYFVALVSGCTAAAVCAVLGAGICYFRLHKSKRDAADAEYPAYGVTGPAKDFSPAAADRKLAQSAHMFHYQHQKQQMIALEKSSGDERHCSTSDVDSEEEGEEGDYTVYECPGLAPTGDMEVKNPIYSNDPTPASPARCKGTNDVRKDNNDEEDDEEELN